MKPPALAGADRPINRRAGQGRRLHDDTTRSTPPEPGDAVPTARSPASPAVVRLPLRPGLPPSDHEAPWLAFYRGPRADAPAVLVCPGGGYGMRADYEGEPVARWLNTLGLHAVVVHYRVAPATHPAPLDDLTEAMRLTRRHAADWSVDPARVGVLGFSAGGHLAATLATLAGPADRPALSILLYPVITLRSPHTHAGSRQNLLPDPTDAAAIDALSPELHVTPTTPPAFLFHTVDDPAVPVENAMLYAAALRRNGVPFEAHLYESGRHGVGLADDHPVLSTWRGLCARWLRSRGWTTLA